MIQYLKLPEIVAASAENDAMCRECRSLDDQGQIVAVLVEKEGADLLGQGNRVLNLAVCA